MHWVSAVDSLEAVALIVPKSVWDRRPYGITLISQLLGQIGKLSGPDSHLSPVNIRKSQARIQCPLKSIGIFSLTSVDSE